MKPNIFAYENYRIYLRELYAYLKANKPSFSYRFFARKAGFRAPNFLKLVIDGKRNLTLKSIKQFAHALDLNNQESEFFECLVLFNQATSTVEKNECYQKMTRCRRYREVRQLEKEIFKYYSNWYYVAIREMVNLTDFQEDPRWIADNLQPTISPQQAAQALKVLMKLKMLERDGAKRLHQVNPIVSTAADVQSLAVSNFHKEMMNIAALSLMTVPRSERDVTSVTVGVSQRQLPGVKKRIERFREELLKTIEAADKPSERIYQLNIQLFPLTKRKGRR